MDRLSPILGDELPAGVIDKNRFDSIGRFSYPVSISIILINGIGCRRAVSSPEEFLHPVVRVIDHPFVFSIKRQVAVLVVIVIVAAAVLVFYEPVRICVDLRILDLVVVCESCRVPPAFFRKGYGSKVCSDE